MPIEARRHIRRMRGGAQSHLIQAADGQYYVVKFKNNPQHRRVLVNELIASVFLRYLQISTPEIAIIRISPEFVKENPELKFQLGAQGAPVGPGWHFGSRFPDDPDRIAIYDFLPDVFLRQVANLHEFAAVLAFDKWMANADGRQAVFFRGQPRPVKGDPRPGRFFALMIDEGFVLNGPYWDFPDSPLQGLYHRPLVYEGIRSWDDFQPWLDRIRHFPEEVMDEAWRQIPLEWIEGEEDALEQVMQKLMERRARVADLVGECRRARSSLFPSWK
ncbi:MAG: HipA family kinase [Acidobacteriota bacterium]